MKRAHLRAEDEEVTVLCSREPPAEEPQEPQAVAADSRSLLFLSFTLTQGGRQRK